jgi:hypothetical protein
MTSVDLSLEAKYFLLPLLLALRIHPHTLLASVIITSNDFHLVYEMIDKNEDLGQSNTVTEMWIPRIS